MQKEIWINVGLIEIELISLVSFPNHRMTVVLPDIYDYLKIEMYR